MARHLTRLLPWLAPLAALAAPVPTQAAAPLGDPTRPPSIVAGSEAAPGDAGGSRLTSVVLPKQGRPLAVIGGQIVPLGGRLGDARLIRVTESEAVLQGPDGVEHLFLTPNIEKKMNVNKAVTRQQRK